MQNGTVVNYYAGIGSRETPPDILREMEGTAHTLNGMRYVLRSGGARGADSAFQNGSGGNAQIFLAKEKSYVQPLHARNMMILFGRNLDNPVDFVVCWTPHGDITGGTGQVLRAAEFFGIPIVNLYNESLTLSKITQFRKEMDEIRFKFRGTVLNRSNSR